MISDEDVYKLHQWLMRKLGHESMIYEDEKDPRRLDTIASEIRSWQIECRRFQVSSDAAKNIAMQIAKDSIPHSEVMKRFFDALSESRMVSVSYSTAGPTVCALCLGTGFATVFDKRDRRRTASVTCSCDKGSRISDVLMNQNDPVRIEDARRPEIARQVREYQRYVNERVDYFIESHGLGGLEGQDLSRAIRDMCHGEIFTVLKG